MPKIDISVDELITKTRRGELLLPEMQRKYVWPATRVRDLLDSLYRGYPSGSILVWETDEEVETREMAVKATQAPGISAKQLLLDGQQRLTSLAAVLSGQPICVRNRQRPIDIMFNLEHPEGPPVEVMELEPDKLAATFKDVKGDIAEKDIQAELKKRTFVVASRSLQADPLWISIADIFSKSDSEILKNVEINSDDKKWDFYSKRLQKVRKIEDYQYVMQVLGRDMSYEEVTEIFVRVNSLGVKLRGSDLALAQITSKWRGFMNIMEEFAKEFNYNENYIIESGLLIRTMIAFATMQSKFKTVGRIKKEHLEKAWEKTQTGLRFVVNFLKSNAYVEKLGVLSSSFLLVPMAIYAVNNDENLSPEEEKKLLKWFYYAHMRGHYSMGSSESMLDADLAVLLKKKSGLDGLIDKLHQHVKKFDVDADDVTNRSIRSPMFSMLYMALKAKGAKDWKTGLALSDEHFGATHRIQYHHIFPKSLLVNKYDKSEINEIANMAFIGGKTNREITNKKPIDYLEKEIIAKRGEDALTTQLVTIDKNLWEIENYRDFLVDRRTKIAEAINKFMEKFE